MQKLLTASLLLAGCIVHSTYAQQAPSVQGNASTAESANQPAQVPDWVAAEFSEAYGRYFPDLPDFYRYSVSQRLRNTPFADLRSDLPSTLAQNTALREAVYQTIYQYCHALKYGLGDSHEVDKLVYLMLYNNFHLSDLAAARLTPYINSRYKQSAPLPQYTAYPTGDQAPDKLVTGSVDRAANLAAYRQAYGRTTTPPEAPSSSPTSTSGMEVSGWRFDNAPTTEAISDEEGAIRFKMKISDKGEIESVTKMSGNVSSAQERLCREALLNAHLVKTNAGASGATGFYTFRFTIR
jgi:hypothetical protein